jgi:hypothetical protein
LFYVLSFIEMVASIVIGAIFLGKQNGACENFGEICLFTAIARFVIGIVFIVAVVIVYLLVPIALYTTPVVTGY